MNTLEAQSHIEECQRMLDKANKCHIKDDKISKAIGFLIIAIDQLSVVVDDLAKREQGKVIA